MTLKKGFTLFEALIVAAIIGVIAAAILPRLHEAQEYNKEKQKIQKEMPQTYKYVSKHSNDDLMLVRFVCKIENTDERVSDEKCYYRMRAFVEDCKNDMPFPVENEEQVEAAIKNCRNPYIEMSRIFDS